MKTIPFQIRKDLQFTSDHIESLFIEVDKSVFQGKCYVIVGALYKPPRLSIDIFNKPLERVLDIIQKEKEYAFYIGDFNIDIKIELQTVSTFTEEFINL